MKSLERLISCMVTELSDQVGASAEEEEQWCRFLHDELSLFNEEYQRWLLLSREYVLEAFRQMPAPAVSRDSGT